MKILVVGGDKRQEYLCEYLKAGGANCIHLKTDKDNEMVDSIGDFSVVILPVPMSSDGEKIFSTDGKLNFSVDKLLSSLKKGQTIMGGRISEKSKKIINERCAQYFDLLEDDTFVIFNAYLTAQGALRLMLQNTQNYITGKNALVTGFGKVAKAMCSTLNNNGVRVHTCARNKKDLFLADCFGYGTLTFEQLKENIEKFDYIFSTVPAEVIKESHIKSMKKDAVYFELASSPYGARKEYFEKYNKIHVMGNSLPGRFCAVTWAEKTADYCLNAMRGEG